MKAYETSNPEWSDTMEILEVTDPGHADNFNVPIKKLFENTLVLKKDTEQSQESIKNALSAENCVIEISDDGNMITTVYEDGARTVTAVKNTSIIKEEYSAEGELISKIGVYITDNKIEVKKLTSEVDNEK
ncbi:MAG: hypothetical protein NC548_38720 [Lachnospiraceae bacterium]|nr:hypothetical protein [Lachnospiraceae bacterium]